MGKKFPIDGDSSSRLGKYFPSSTSIQKPAPRGFPQPESATSTPDQLTNIFPAHHPPGNTQLIKLSHENPTGKRFFSPLKISPQSVTGGECHLGTGCEKPGARNTNVTMEGLSRDFHTTGRCGNGMFRDRVGMPASEGDRGIRLCPSGPLGLRIARRKDFVHPAKGLRVLGMLVLGNPF